MPESDSGSTVFNFTVTLDDPPVFQSVSVDYATADGTAAAGEDYEATSGWVTFDPGETEKYIPVTIFGDFICESHETFTVKLFNPVNATIAGGAVALSSDRERPTAVGVPGSQRQVRHGWRAVFEE